MSDHDEDELKDPFADKPADEEDALDDSLIDDAEADDVDVDEDEEEDEDGDLLWNPDEE